MSIIARVIRKHKSAMTPKTELKKTCSRMSASSHTEFQHRPSAQSFLTGRYLTTSEERKKHICVIPRMWDGVGCVGVTRYTAVFRAGKKRYWFMHVRVADIPVGESDDTQVSNPNSEEWAWIKNLDWKLSADWLTPIKRWKCVDVLQFCVVKTASTNQLRCDSRFNQSAIRKHPSGWLI